MTYGSESECATHYTTAPHLWTLSLVVISTELATVSSSFCTCDLTSVVVEIKICIDLIGSHCVCVCDIQWSEFMAIGSQSLEAELERRIRAQAPNKCCTIIYTVRRNCIYIIYHCTRSIQIPRDGVYELVYSWNEINKNSKQYLRLDMQRSRNNYDNNNYFQKNLSQYMNLLDISHDCMMVSSRYVRNVALRSTVERAT